MPIPIAKLNGQNLPIQFSYQPYITEKRNSIQGTNGSVVVQNATPQIVHGEDSINWKIDAATPLEFKTLFDLYNTTAPVLYSFVGYWGEQMGVYFTVFDKPSVKGRVFFLSGRFQVMTVISWYSPTCGF